MVDFQRAVFPILFNGSPLLVTPIGDEPTSTYLVDLEETHILLDKHCNPDGLVYWTEYGKGITLLSTNIGKAIEEKNRTAIKIK